MVGQRVGREQVGVERRRDERPPMVGGLYTQKPSRPPEVDQIDRGPKAGCQPTAGITQGNRVEQSVAEHRQIEIAAGAGLGPGVAAVEPRAEHSLPGECGSEFGEECFTKLFQGDHDSLVYPAAASLCLTRGWPLPRAKPPRFGGRYGWFCTVPFRLPPRPGEVSHPPLRPGQPLPATAGVNRKGSRGMPLARPPGLVGNRLKLPGMGQEREDALVVAVMRAELGGDFEKSLREQGLKNRLERFNPEELALVTEGLDEGLDEIIGDRTPGPSPLEKLVGRGSGGSRPSPVDR